MKKSIKSFTVLTLFLFLSTISFSQKSTTSFDQFGQQCSGVNLTRNIHLKGSSSTEKIKIEVTENTNCIHLGINSIIQSGSLTIEVYDPKGNKQGNFSVESQIGSNKQFGESVCGQIQKTIKTPLKGEWIVKLIPNKAKGEVSICTSMTQKQ